MNPTLSRRDFLARTALATAACAAAPSLLSAAAAAKPTYQIGLLEKWFFDGGTGGPLKYTPEQMATVLDEIGLDLELTLRKDGHIKPENTADELPPMVAALAKKNRRILWLAIDTVRPDEPHWQKAVRVGKQLGIPQVRHRGFRYDATKPLKPQLANFHSMTKEFAAAAKEIGFQWVYQTHAGAQYVGAGCWDLDTMLEGVDPKHFGVAFDTRHVMVEQGLAWPTAIQLLAPKIVALCVKSFQWEGDNATMVPLDQGRVKKDIVTKVIAAAGGPIPICIHNEYFKGAAGKLAAVPFDQRAGIVEAFRSDAKVLRKWLGVA